MIPNPSFEDRNCCPMVWSELDDCAVDWIQASAPTSDYFHYCGISAKPNMVKHYKDNEDPYPIPGGGL